MRRHQYVISLYLDHFDIISIDNNNHIGTVLYVEIDGYIGYEVSDYAPIDFRVI